MTNTLKLTAELNAKMHPQGKQVYSANSLPSYTSKEQMTWSNNDEQYIIQLDLRTGTFAGHYYDWNEETQDWDDAHDVEMTPEQILSHITEDRLLMVTLGKRIA